MLENLIFFLGKLSVRTNNFFRYVKGTYDNVSPTIGVEFAYKIVNLKN
jgi:hypothetical protein